MERIYQVGVFKTDTHHTKKPTDHRAYLVCGEKNALIDGVPSEYTAEYLENIEQILPIAEIDYLIFTHTEQEYTGAFSAILEKNPNICVIATVAGLRNLKEQYNGTFCEQVAKNSARLDLGNTLGLEFLIAPNLDWPDTMLVYCEEEKAVFSADFGSCYCMENQEEAFGLYYRDVLKTHGIYVENALDILEKKACNKLFAGHGEAPQNWAECYRKWSKKIEHQPKKICICYESLYGSTEEMAKVLEGKFQKEGFEVLMLRAGTQTPDEMAEVLHESDAWVFGVPTVHRKPPVSMLDILNRIDVFCASRKVSGVFGSYGWSGEACTVVQHYLEDIRTEFCPKPVRSIFKPDEKVFTELEAYADRFVKKIREKEREF